MKILCVYATRQMDSNLMMSSTVFDGLHQNGYDVDIVFGGTCETRKVFSSKYSKYFRKTYFVEIQKTCFENFIKKSPLLSLIYSWWQHFVIDQFLRPYSKSSFKDVVDGIKMSGEEYDMIISFIPPIVSGLLAFDINKICFDSKTKVIQFWTDPLSLGKCNDVSEIPWYRFMHRRAEEYLLRYTDKAIFCYPLLCEMEQKLYPQYRDKMVWSDVGYMEHTPIKKYEYTIGFFGSYSTSVRNIKPLLDSSLSFEHIKFIIRGDSDYKFYPNEYPNVDMKVGRISQEEVERMENDVDILVILGNKGGIQIPGKVYYYANYNKPLICICDSKHSEYLKEYLSSLNRYIIADNSIESIETAIKTAIVQLTNQCGWEIPDRLEPRNIAKKIVEGL